MNIRAALRLLGLVAAVLLVASACGSDATGETDTADTEPSQPTSPPPPLTLYVSNQSSEDQAVWITITLDGGVGVDQRFDVEGGHNWIVFEPDLTPGEHTLTAVSDTGAELTIDFDSEAGQPLWAVVDYWWDLEEGLRSFTFDVSEEPIGFA